MRYHIIKPGLCGCKNKMTVPVCFLLSVHFKVHLAYCNIISMIHIPVRLPSVTSPDPPEPVNIFPVGADFRKLHHACIECTVGPVQLMVWYRSKIINLPVCHGTHHFHDIPLIQTCREFSGGLIAFNGCAEICIVLIMIYMHPQNPR